jgi:hypothetical protein
MPRSAQRNIYGSWRLSSTKSSNVFHTFYGSSYVEILIRHLRRKPLLRCGISRIPKVHKICTLHGSSVLNIQGYCAFVSIKCGKASLSLTQFFRYDPSPERVHFLKWVNSRVWEQKGIFLPYRQYLLYYLPEPVTPWTFSSGIPPVFDEWCFARHGFKAPWSRNSPFRRAWETSTDGPILPQRRLISQ